jgi:hypothetical protein
MSQKPGDLGKLHAGLEEMGRTRMAKKMGPDLEPEPAPILAHSTADRGLVETASALVAQKKSGLSVLTRKLPASILEIDSARA